MAFDVFGARPQPGLWSIRSLDVTATLAFDGRAVSRRMAEAAAAHRRAVGSHSARILAPSRPTDAPPSVDWDRTTWRVQWASTSWREEIVYSNGQRVTIIVTPTLAMTYVSMERALYTSESSPAAARGERQTITRHPTIADRLAEFPLTGFRLPSVGWDLTTVGEEMRETHRTRRMRAARRAGAAHAEEASHWRWLDAFEYLVDEELGVLLELTGIDGERPVTRIAADDWRVDAPVPPDAFAFSPPDGTRIIHVPRTAGATG